MSELIELDQSPPSLDRLSAFFHGVYAGSFPDGDERETLENMAGYLRLKAQGWYGESNYHLLLLEDHGAIIGGCVSDYLGAPNCGVIEFLAVAPAFRGRGLASRLLAHTQHLLTQDAQARHHRGLDFLLGEVEDPQFPQSWAGGFDPVDRLRIWARWGFAAVDFPYTQPALRAQSAPVTHLMLMAKAIQSHSPQHISSSQLQAVIHEYLRLAMRIEAPPLCAEYQAMATALSARQRVRLLPLPGALHTA